MSVIVDRLVKVYGRQKALDSLSFEAPSGMITGFLGPNGAGKSTAMKVAAGYILPDSGTVLVNGVDVGKDSLKVKKMMGYLSEHNPLYVEMYVKEYLGFVAASYKIRERKRKIDEVVELCGLTSERKKKIRMLSKGYRQRVGLAQTLIHDPQVLILDEPTGGLDPNQLVEIRKVIREAGKKKTVILSTHIMQEVEALCDKVVIIHKGKVAADGQVLALKSIQREKVAYRVTFECAIEAGAFENEGLRVERIDSNLYRMEGLHDPGNIIMKLVAQHSLPLVSITKEAFSLEEVFQALTNEA